MRANNYFKSMSVSVFGPKDNLLDKKNLGSDQLYSFK